MALAAQSEASAPITSVAGLFGQNAAPNAGRSIVDVFTPSQADEPEGSGPAIEANAEAPGPLRAALPERLQSVVPKPFQSVRQRRTARGARNRGAPRRPKSRCARRP